MSRRVDGDAATVDFLPFIPVCVCVCVRSAGVFPDQ